MADSSHQVLILDVNPYIWSKQSRDSKNLVSFREYIDIISIFARSHVMLHKDNTVQILAAHPSGCTVLYPSGDNRSDLDLSHLSEHLLPSLMNSSEKQEEAGERSVQIPYLAQALSQSLCAINRRLLMNQSRQSKILVLQISQDSPSNYNAIMNAIFSAQKFVIPVDALLFSNEDSSFLQQACLLTGGIYCKPTDQKDSLQLLLMHYLPCAASRKILQSPLQTNVDFKASCTCHNKPVDFTFMCSVCLSLFCPDSMSPDSTECEICGTKIR
jgi:transcription initiation factor TFIIH subunit 3